MSGASGAPAMVIAHQGRKAVIFADDGRAIAERFAFEFDGEPVSPTEVAVFKQELGRGVNQLDNGDFSNPSMPWRIVGDARGKLGRNFLPQWHLADGFTGYLTIPRDKPVLVEYATQDGGVIPVIEHENYRFEGYFGRHRCAASVVIDLLNERSELITSVRETISAKTGGRSLDEFACVGFDLAVPASCIGARLRLSVDGFIGSDSRDVFLFFSHLSFGLAGRSDAPLRSATLNGKQAVALAGKAAALSVTVPRSGDGALNRPLRLDVIDTATGEAVPDSPLLGATSDIALAVANFDGVTLTGTVTGRDTSNELELVIDGATASKISVAKAQGNSSAPVKLRIPAAFLDGAPHVIEVRDAVSGKTLFLNAALLKAVLTPWENGADLRQWPAIAELHPMARRRYRSLLAHSSALARQASSQDVRREQLIFRQLAACHDIVVRDDNHLSFSIPLAVPAESSSDVSIIMTSRDLRAVYRTVAALLLAHNDIRWEVIVATDDEAGRVAAFRKSVSGVTVVECPREAGRTALCNAAVKKARGRFVAMLAESSEPGPGWLDELRRSFDLFDNVGVAGSRLLQNSGRLDQAGGVLWSSGVPQALFRQGNPEHPQVTYARQADYVSSAALMIAREFWDELGGLSPDVLDPVLQDADLALRAKSAGRTVIYVPQSVVTVSPEPAGRLRGGRASADFKRRWASALQKQPAESPSMHAIMDGCVAGRVLFVDQQVPRADIDAGSYAAIQEMRLFQSLGFKVTFLPTNLMHAGIYTDALQRMGVETVYAPFASSVEEVFRERATEFHCVYITRYHVARAVVPFMRRFNARAKIVFNNADLHFLRELRVALANKDQALLRRSELTRAHELEVMRLCDLTLTYSDVEQAVIESHNRDQTRTAKAPWVVTPAPSIPEFYDRKDLLFLGSFGHRPNVDAIRFFVSEVMPVLRTTLPGVALRICGSQMTPEIKSLESGDVKIIGQVEDLATVFNKARLFVAPLPAGAGIKGKVLSAMSYGVPAILTKAAAEGLGAQPGVDYVAANSAIEIARAVQTLYHDESRWKAISVAALEFVRSHYSFEQGQAALRSALETIDIFPPPNPSALYCKAPLPPLK